MKRACLLLLLGLSGCRSSAKELLAPPPAASDVAPRVDALFGFVLLYSVFFSVLIAVLILYLGWRHRRRAPDAIGEKHRGSTAPLEITWTAIPLGILLATFAWGARVYVQVMTPPARADEYLVVGKQWMWKVQHPEGPREINTLHVPRGRAIRLTMTSEDVIHSFYVPAFRVKKDVVPGLYTTVWFRPTRAGVYHLFCAEYCGTEHSRMGGSVVVLEPAEYEQWLAGEEGEERPAVTGEAVFRAQGCPTCHRPDSSARAPILNGLPGRRVHLASGKDIVADDAYLRESILRPAAKVVKGYSPVMPTFEGRLSEEDVMLLISYIRSLPPAGEGGPR